MIVYLIEKIGEYCEDNILTQTKDGFGIKIYSSKSNAKKILDRLNRLYFRFNFHPANYCYDLNNIITCKPFEFILKYNQIINNQDLIIRDEFDLNHAHNLDAELWRNELITLSNDNLIRLMELFKIRKFRIRKVRK